MSFKSRSDDDSYSVNANGVTVVDANKLFALDEVQKTLKTISLVFRADPES